ncbi:ARMT1-like domain-containing protein [Pyrolobus fumarii]|uniref:ARMT1-like domain-containing protein n=1 Tax=Pyrolobus fumarii TaxID=54252 RepID=UPI00064EBE25|nr:ARMT1-like domain-containing protein [Pyrolobus fumarii]
MKVKPLCAACTLLTRARELEKLSGLNVEDSLASFRSIAESVGVYLGPDIELSLLATVSFRRLKSIVGVDDVYAEIKKELEPAVREAVETINEKLLRLEGTERFHFALKAAVAGNALDLARPYLDPYIHDATSVSRIELRRNEAAELYNLLHAGKVNVIAYVFDSSLEALYDTLFIKVLRENGATVIGVVKSDTFEDDATIKELKRLGVIDYLDDVIETGSDAASLIVDEVNEEAIKVVNDADAVIVKGAMNHLHFVNNRLGKRVYSLMRVPCKFLAQELGVNLGSYVAVRAI